MAWPALEEFIWKTVATETPPVRQLLAHVLSGGKGLRPTLVRLCAQFGPHDPGEVNRVAAAIELVHVASLIHDDILDGATTRRHRPALHCLYGALPAVLVGDYLFATAFGLLAQGPRAALEAVTAAIRAMCAGEIQQRLTSPITEQAYFEFIGKKTAALISAACRCGGILAGLKPAQQEALACFGWHLGTAYQLMDDLLDLLGRPEEAGKPCRQDLSQGLITLPILRFLQFSSDEDLWLEKISRGLAPEEAEEIIEAARVQGCCEYARERAREQINMALANLTNLPSCPAEKELVWLAVQILDKLGELNCAGPAQEDTEPE
ncbi:polyprenyl synthetase family protein [Moorellaceae bacterium AZ2]